MAAGRCPLGAPRCRPYGPPSNPCRADDAQALACFVGGEQSCLGEGIGDMSAQAETSMANGQIEDALALPIGTALGASTGAMARRHPCQRVRGGLVAALGVVLAAGLTTAGAQTQYEDPAILRAADILPSELLQSLSTRSTSRSRRTGS
jgi:hypothetical protein